MGNECQHDCHKAKKHEGSKENAITTPARHLIEKLKVDSGFPGACLGVCQLTNDGWKHTLGLSVSAGQVTTLLVTDAGKARPEYSLLHSFRV